MGVPVIGCTCEACTSSDVKDNRLRCSILIQKNGSNFVIDSGPDFRYQMLRAKVTSLRALIFTHEHKDHTAGMDDVRAFNWIQREKVNIYATERVEKALRNDFHYAFADIKYPGVPELEIHNITKQPFRIDDVDFIPVEVMHHKLRVLGFRIDDFVYITDVNHIPEEEMKKLKGCDTLVLSALRQTTHISHFSLEQAVELIQRVKPRKGYLTHISHQMGRHKDVSTALPDNVEIAYDGLELTW
ncbi:MAG: MBL fold metallo-hydrolase [Flavobacteriales bacterium]|jgi:phosphoribosyl 1,2-cyclic phosphate phosphodiesterase|nr:MBL fold metallo-hydrolase [Flavobacteriales bacterium]NCG31181.1 MBL fold metallo-hydrolase [Bacteroidota bacterium]MBT3964082.1 MBL fold metallo-hydrolase [Flavobacteriales bacterium]MBT4704078.1 MBL fold metallo-hydrolase [Flavobacteriales bacterium]MBT4930725.1 MBL fold metallo-hydrolase [Flavobacteriales bacterium]